MAMGHHAPGFVDSGMTAIEHLLIIPKTISPKPFDGRATSWSAWMKHRRSARAPEHLGLGCNDHVAE